MCFGEYKSPAIRYFLSSRFLPLDLLYFKSVAVLVHGISNNLSPPNIAHLFISKIRIHSHNTRLSSVRGDYFVKLSRLDLEKFVIYLKTNFKLKSTISYSNDFQKKMTVLICLNNKNVLIFWLLVLALCIDLILDDMI